MIAKKFPRATAAEMCRTVNKVICTLGVPHIIVTDNGPQFISENFAQLMKKWDIIHRTSSPRNLQANGHAERVVPTFKKLVAKNVEIEYAIMCYNDSPLQNGYTPAQLLMGEG
ncbi:igE-binding protein-like [Watersipora subatra]|uniref:igE-binding protein-like n=1 Tax=Watersipora subatra TaxID=2589382 RepID=UPI00355C4014